MGWQQMKKGCFAKRSTKIICGGLTSLKYSWKVTKKEESSKLTVRSQPALSKSGLRVILLSLHFMEKGPEARNNLLRITRHQRQSQTHSQAHNLPITNLSSPPTVLVPRAILPSKLPRKSLRTQRLTMTQNSKHKIEEPVVILLKTRAKTGKHTFISDKWHPGQKGFAWM